MADKLPKKPKDGKKMSDTDISNFLSSAILDAEDYIDSNIAPDREKATEYYRGDPFGNEEDGRSQVVMTEVRDVVQAMLPSLLRVFLSTENVVEYAPRRADSVALAEQQTDYINYLFYVKNQGAQILYSAFKDALVRKTGVVKWYIEEKKTVTEEKFTNLTDDDLTALTLNDDPTEEIEITELNELLPPGFDSLDAGGLETAEPEPALYSATVRRTVTKKELRVEAVPPEEFLIARNARDIETADFVGHRKDELVSNLVAMGFDLDEILEHGNARPVMELNQESRARNPALAAKEVTDTSKLDPSMLRVKYYESFARFDADGDGVAELHRLCSIGDAGDYVLYDEVVSTIDFALFCPDPEPHTAIGYSVADQVMDLQKIKSNIVRNTLDSLAQSIHPRTAVVEGQVNMDDVLNTEVGGIIRMRQIGAVQPLDTPFVGQAALPILAYLDDTRAQRTGISRATQGLDADVLQSTTKEAVTATVTAAEARLEMVARIFADTGMKQLFRGLLKTVVQNFDREEVVRLRGKWVSVNPQGWDAEADVIVNVGLGLGDRAEKVAVLTSIAQKQEQALQLLGPQNPLVDLSQYRATLGKILEHAGLKDTETYFKQITPEALQQMQQQMQQNQKPDPAQILAQVEQEKTQADIAIARAKLMLEEQKMKLDADLERDKLDADTTLKAMEMQAKYGVQVNLAELQNRLERQRLIVQTAITLAENEAAANAPPEPAQPAGPTQ